MLHKAHVFIKLNRALVEYRRSLFLLEQLSLLGVQARDRDVLASMLNPYAAFFELDVVEAFALKIVIGKRRAK